MASGRGNYVNKIRLELLLYYKETDHKPWGFEFNGHAFNDVGGNDWLLWHNPFFILCLKRQQLPAKSFDLSCLSLTFIISVSGYCSALEAVKFTIMMPISLC